MLAPTKAEGEDAAERSETHASTSFLRKIPKSDLHVHLDGSIRLSTLIDLAKEYGVSLPSYDERTLRQTVFPVNYNSLEEYLEGFKYTTSVMQTAEACERVAFEFAEDLFSENVRYFEVRFAPQLHCSVDPADKFGIRDVLRAVNRGLQRAAKKFNDDLKAAQEKGSRLLEPTYTYGIIVCAMRSFFKGMSRFYDGLYAVHPDESADAITSMASVILVLATVKARDDDGIPIAGVDIAGAERGHEASVHTKAFEIAHNMFMHKTVHAGEGFGPESIGQAIKYLHAERIGHGFHLFSWQHVEGKRKPTAKSYVDRLVRWVCDLRITMEVCLTSNLNTMPHLKLEDHPFKRMVRDRVSVTIATDNRLVSNTDTVKELSKAVRVFRLSPRQLREIVIAGFKKSFFPGTYAERRKYVRTVMNYYDSIAKEHGIPTDSNGPASPLK